MKIIIFITALLINGLDLDQKEINVYVFIAEECPICNYMGKPLAEIANEYGDQVNFYAVFPLNNSNYKSINLFKTKYGLEGFESILDSDQSLTKKLGATVTPEVVITDGLGSTIYKGRINDAYFAPGKRRHAGKKNDLKDAIERAIQGVPISKKWEKAIGCFITFY